MNQQTSINEENVKNAFRFILRSEPDNAKLCRFQEMIGTILTDMEERVIAQRFGFYGNSSDEMPFSEIAVSFGVSVERIESVYRNAIIKMRSPFACKAILGE